MPTLLLLKYYMACNTLFMQIFIMMPPNDRRWVGGAELCQPSQSDTGRQGYLVLEKRPGTITGG